MSALGRDILGTSDVDRFLTIGPPRQSAAESVLRSLLHNPGALWWAPERGYHLARHLHAFFDADQIETAVRQQLEADERVESAVVRATRLGDEVQLRIEVVFTNDPRAVLFTVSVADAIDIFLENV